VLRAFSLMSNRNAVMTQRFAAMLAYCWKFYCRELLLRSCIRRIRLMGSDLQNMSLTGHEFESLVMGLGQELNRFHIVRMRHTSTREYFYGREVAEQIIAADKELEGIGCVDGLARILVPHCFKRVLKWCACNADPCLEYRESATALAPGTEDRNQLAMPKPLFPAIMSRLGL